MVSEVIKAAGPFRFALINLHQVVFIKVNLLKRDGISSTNLLCRLWVLLVVFRKTMVKKKSIDELYSLQNVLAGLRRFNLVFKLFKDANTELLTKSVDL